MKLSSTRGLTVALATSVALSTALSLSASATAAPARLSLVASSADGLAFDLGENTAGDLSVQLTDSLAGSVDAGDAQDLAYYWLVTPFDTAVAPTRFPTTGTTTADVDVAGRFDVALPPGQVSGTYVLVAALGPNARGARAVPARRVLTVKAGQAVLDLDQAGPLLLAAGADHPLTGTLALEDGTGLSGRLVDLALTRGTRGTDRQADAVVTPAQVTTAADGTFATVLSDPAEAGQGSELGGTLEARTAVTPDVGDAGATTSRQVDLVNETLPAGATVTITDLGTAASTPGRSRSGTLSVTAPDDTYDLDPSTPGVQGDSDRDRDPVVDQRVALSLDHGFFTTGQEVLPSVVGAPAGTLVDLGAARTVLTGADGTVPFAVTIGRDAGFDDDARVTATMSAAVGDTVTTEVAEWDTASPLNGRVSLELSPASEQPAAVAPALAGDRTYYEVFTRDQFGNPVDDQPVDLAFAGDLDDWDYSEDSAQSDLDLDGDIWVVSFETADIDVTATTSAPTFLYTDTAGAARSGRTVATGTTTASFYEVDFAGTTVTSTTTATDTVRVGSTVSQTVRVLDQLGNPVQGFEVEFFRSGPDPRNTGEPRARAITNARGEATYTFSGTQVGRARLAVTVSDGADSRTVTSVVDFGNPVRARLSGDRTGGRRPDQLTLQTSPEAAGARVTLLRVVGGKQQRVRSGVLGKDGSLALTVRDTNGARATAYVVSVASTRGTVATTSNRFVVR